MDQNPGRKGKYIQKFKLTNRKRLIKFIFETTNTWIFSLFAQRSDQTDANVF